MLSRGQTLLIGAINLILIAKIIYDFFFASVGVFQVIVTVAFVIFSLSHIGRVAIQSEQNKYNKK